VGYSQYWSRSCMMEAIRAVRAAGNRCSPFDISPDNRFGHASTAPDSVICLRHLATTWRLTFMSHLLPDTLPLGGAMRETTVGLSG